MYDPVCVYVRQELMHSCSFLYKCLAAVIHGILVHFYLTLGRISKRMQGFSKVWRTCLAFQSDYPVCLIDAIEYLEILRLVYTIVFFDFFFSQEYIKIKYIKIYDQITSFERLVK